MIVVKYQKDAVTYVTLTYVTICYHIIGGKNIIQPLFGLLNCTKIYVLLANEVLSTWLSFWRALFIICGDLVM